MPMPKLTADVSNELLRQIDRIIRDGWFADHETLVRQALNEFVDARSFLGDSPRMLHRFAADALNESKPDVALKFVSRALSLLDGQEATDYALFQALIELKVQILLVLSREEEALQMLEEAKVRLPNNPAIERWVTRLRKTRQQ